MDIAAEDIDAASTRRALALRNGLYALYILTGVVYFGWRLTVFNPAAPIFSTVFFVVELAGFGSGMLLFFVSRNLKHRIRPAALPGQSVDVFITTFNEPLDIVRRALVSARRIRYPHQTWLLDDGNRSEFRLLAEELGCRYLCRARNVHAKAGNLNNALRFANGDFILVLDADHCAQADFIDRTLGHFSDPSVGFVQTPQEFYNFDSFQHGRARTERLIWHEQSRFNHVEQPGRDHHGSVLMCGCSCVIRRAALDSIGGFATGSVTEDMHTAVRMMKRGWKPVYHHEALAFGLAPPDFVAFTRQRLRWAEGNLQVCRMEGLPFVRGIGWRANLCYALLTLYYVDAWRKLVLYIAPPISLLTDTPPVYGEFADFWLFFLPFLICGVLTFKEFSDGYGRAWRAETDAMARMTAGLPAISGLFRSQIRFRVTPKTTRGGMPLGLVAPQLAILAGGLVAVAYACVKHAAILLGRHPDDGIPLSIAWILVVLTLYHCVVAFKVLKNVRAAAKPSPPNLEHAIALPIRIRMAGKPSRIVFTTRLSVEAATVAQTAETSELAPHVAEIDLFLPSGPVSTNALLERSSDGSNLRIVFLWPDLRTRDELDHALHAESWTRLVTGRFEATPTPLEWSGLLPVRPEHLPGAHPLWEPVLLGAGQDEPVLAFLRPQSDSYSELLAFRDLPSRVEVIACRRADAGGTWATARTAPDDADGLKNVDGYRLAVSRVPAGGGSGDRQRSSADPPVVA
jgi:cellulose synthase/poly-beta-1,6-N-acetylglucosamine synthase-like glycosyltransferase